MWFTEPPTSTLGSAPVGYPDFLTSEQIGKTEGSRPRAWWSSSVVRIEVPGVTKKLRQIYGILNYQGIERCAIILLVLVIRAVRPPVYSSLRLVYSVNYIFYFRCPSTQNIIMDFFFFWEGSAARYYIILLLNINNSEYSIYTTTINILFISCSYSSSALFLFFFFFLKDCWEDCGNIFVIIRIYR